MLSRQVSLLCTFCSGNLILNWNLNSFVRKLSSLWVRSTTPSSNQIILPNIIAWMYHDTDGSFGDFINSQKTSSESVFKMGILTCCHIMSSPPGAVVFLWSHSSGCSTNISWRKRSFCIVPSIFSLLLVVQLKLLWTHRNFPTRASRGFNLYWHTIVFFCLSFSQSPDCNLASGCQSNLSFFFKS